MDSKEAHLHLDYLPLHPVTMHQPTMHFYMGGGDDWLSQPSHEYHYEYHSSHPVAMHQPTMHFYMGGRETLSRSEPQRRSKPHWGAAADADHVPAPGQPLDDSFYVALQQYVPYTAASVASSSGSSLSQQVHPGALMYSGPSGHELDMHMQAQHAHAALSSFAGAQPPHRPPMGAPPVPGDPGGLARTASSPSKLQDPSIAPSGAGPLSYPAGYGYPPFLQQHGGSSMQNPYMNVHHTPATQRPPSVSPSADPLWFLATTVPEHQVRKQAQARGPLPSYFSGESTMAPVAYSWGALQPEAAQSPPSCTYPQHYAADLATYNAVRAHHQWRRQQQQQQQARRASSTRASALPRPPLSYNPALLSASVVPSPQVFRNESSPPSSSWLTSFPLSVSVRSSSYPPSRSLSPSSSLSAAQRINLSASPPAPSVAASPVAGPPSSSATTPETVTVSTPTCIIEKQYAVRKTESDRMNEAERKELVAVPVRFLKKNPRPHGTLQPQQAAPSVGCKRQRDEDGPSSLLSEASLSPAICPVVAPRSLQGAVDGELYIPATDIGPLLNIRKNNIPGYISKYDSSLRQQMMVVCPRAIGGFARVRLHVLTIAGAEKLIMSSRSKQAKKVWAWVQERVSKIQNGLHLQQQQDAEAAAVVAPPPSPCSDPAPLVNMG